MVAFRQFHIRVSSVASALLLFTMIGRGSVFWNFSLFISPSDKNIERERVCVCLCVCMCVFVCVCVCACV